MAFSIQINGVTITGNQSIKVSGNKVIVDGKDITPDAKVISITVSGNIETLSADTVEKIEVTGSCGSVKTMSGDVTCHSVSGYVNTMSGDIICNQIAGDASTMSGDIISN
jgi:hypothetical protein